MFHFDRKVNRILVEIRREKDNSLFRRNNTSNNKEFKNIKKCKVEGEIMWLEPEVFVQEAAKIRLEIRKKMPVSGANHECLQYCAVELAFTSRRDVYHGLVIPTLMLSSA